MVKEMLMNWWINLFLFDDDLMSRVFDNNIEANRAYA